MIETPQKNGHRMDLPQHMAIKAIYNKPTASIILRSFYHKLVLNFVKGFLISPGYSLELCIQIGTSFLFSFAFCFLSFHNIEKMERFLEKLNLPSLNQEKKKEIMNEPITSSKKKRL